MRSVAKPKLAGSWVHVDAVAKHLGVARDSVCCRGIESKGLPAHRVGRVGRFKVSEVDAWVRAGGANEFAGKQEA